MKSITNKFQIGEKIGVGFGLVGLLFLLVIWQYHSTLKKSLEEFQQLSDVYVAKKELLSNIEEGLLNSRIAEKQFLLKHNTSHAQSVNQQVMETLETVYQFSQIDQAAEASAKQFRQDLNNYLQHFQLVEASWLEKGLDENSGLQGSFRDAAHTLEDMVARLENDKIYVNILQLRRREKDYLLRGDDKYIDLALKAIQTIKQQLETSRFTGANREQFSNYLNNYQRDFIALAEQNKHIEAVVEDMENAAINVTQLVSDNVILSKKNMLEQIKAINSANTDRTSLMLWIVLIASILGIYFAITIAASIARPLRKMAGLLEKLTRAEIVEKMSYQKGGRDEVNEMAGSLNTLADHRKRLIGWWENSMNEAEAYTQLKAILELAPDKSPGNTQEMQQTIAELADILKEKRTLLTDEYQKIRQYSHNILDQSARLNHVSISRGDIDESANIIHNSASLIQQSLDILSSDTPVSHQAVLSRVN